MRIRFVKAVSLNVVETKNIDGKLEILEYVENLPVNKMIEVVDVFPTKNVSKVNFQVELEDSIKLYQDAELTTLTIHNGTPSYMQPPPGQAIQNAAPAKKCGGCPGRR